MAPRKPKPANTSQSFDTSKFVSVVTSNRNTNHLRLTVIQERGLITTSDLEVSKTIKDNKWEVLCKHLDTVVVPIVREFYANGIAQEDFKVMVRG